MSLENATHICGASKGEALIKILLAIRCVGVLWRAAGPWMRFPVVEAEPVRGKW